MIFLIDYKTLNEIIVELISNIHANIPEADTKIGTFLRDAIVDPFSLSLSKLYTQMKKMEMGQSILTAIGNDLETLDANFFNTEISIFADIVLATIRSCDSQLGLNGQLEQIFAQEFKIQYGSYRAQQIDQINGDIPLRTTKKNAASSHAPSANDFNSAGSIKH